MSTKNPLTTKGTKEHEEVQSQKQNLLTTEGTEEHREEREIGFDNMLGSSLGLAQFLGLGGMDWDGRRGDGIG